MKTTMFEYFKIILYKVSFNRKLFRKEFKKSLRSLSQDEVYRLKEWIRNNGLVEYVKN